VGDPVGINAEQFLQPLLFWRAEDQADVFGFFDLIDDLGIVVVCGVGLVDPGEGEGDAGVFFAELWGLVGFFGRCGFELCPLAPEVEV
jgi:hypothetical protein